MRFLAPVLANLWLLLSAIGWGSLVCPLFPSTFSRIDRWAAIPLTGLGVQGLLLFLLGMARFTQLVILLVFGLGAILGLRWIWQELASTGRSSRNLGIVPIPLAVIGLVLLVTLVGGLSEPCGTLRTDDSIAYHYLGPKVWLRDGVIHPVFDESLTAFPATVEIQYAPLLAFGGPRGPAFFSVTSLVLMLLVVASLALRCGLSSPQAWWLLALVSAMPAVYRGLHGGMIDVIYACFLLMAARFALDAERPADFIVSGLFCGFAIGSKYTGLLAAPLLCLCVLLFPKNSPRPSVLSTLKLLALGATVASFVAAPWYIRNWIVAGCPIYPPPPVLAKYFAARYLPAGAIEKINDLMLKMGQGLGKDFVHLLLLPFNLTFHTANFEGGAGGIGLVPLAFLPFAFRARTWDAFAKGLGLFGVLMTLVWFYTAQESRYLIQVYLIAAIFGVAGWEAVVRNVPRITRPLAALVVAVSVLYGLFMITTGRIEDVRSVISPAYAERRRQAEIPFLASYRYLNSDPSVGKVLVLDSFVPSYYLDKDYLKPLGRHGEQAMPGIQSAGDALADLQKWRSPMFWTSSGRTENLRSRKIRKTSRWCSKQTARESIALCLLNRRIVRLAAGFGALGSCYILGTARFRLFLRSGLLLNPGSGRAHFLSWWQGRDERKSANSDSSAREGIGFARNQFRTRCLRRHPMSQ